MPFRSCTLENDSESMDAAPGSVAAAPRAEAPCVATRGDTNDGAVAVVAAPTHMHAPTRFSSER